MTGRDLIPHDPVPYDPPPYDPTRDAKVQDPRVVRRNQAKVERGFWGKLRRNLGRVPFLEEAVSAYYCAFDPQTPRTVKAMLLAALAYFVVPSDLIPDFIAGLGFTDDATVLYLTVRSVAGAITPRHRRLARRRLAALGFQTASPAASQPD